jgi:biopolymer transport protein ExbB
MNLLQIVTTDSVAAVSADESLTVLSLLTKGGWTMIPIFILSIAAIYIFVERLLTLQKASKLPQNFIENIKKMVLDGDVAGAKSSCSNISAPTAKMIEKGLKSINWRRI